MTATNEARPLGTILESDANAGAGLKQRIRDRAEAIVDEGKEAVEHLGTKMRGQVRERPLASLVVAGGVGLLLGMLIARKP